jgi:hypothetical protein
MLKDGMALTEGFPLTDGTTLDEGMALTEGFALFPLARILVAEIALTTAAFIFLHGSS